MATLKIPSLTRALLAAGLLLAAACACFGQSSGPLLLQKPTLSPTQIAFVYGGDLWTAPREGGEARRLTVDMGIPTEPYFSPDGTIIAFTGQNGGNFDVYVIPSMGGQPKRLTYHPGADICLGWTPDGKNLLFASARGSYSRFTRLFTIGVGAGAEGAFPKELPLPMGREGSFSPDGSRLAYVPVPHAFDVWKRYRGGRTTPIWLANLSDSSIERIPRNNSNDFDPMWVGNKVYFLSDRNGPVTLFAYDVNSKQVSQLIDNKGLDIKSASAATGAIVYEQFGSIQLYDLGSGKEHTVNISLAADLPEVRPHFKKVADDILSANLSPTGMRAVFEAHGDILTVPAEKGDIRNLTNTPGVAERHPVWSPDGKWIAYFSDESGEYALHISDQSGTGNVKKISLGNPSTFYSSPVWSPDSKKIAFTDKRLSLWYVDLDKGTPVKVDTTTYDSPFPVFNPAWSPDSKWLTYTKQLLNRMCAVYVYSMQSGKASQITDGMSDARFASFDKNGKYIYFTASTDNGPTTGWLDMSSFGHNVTRSAYVVVLSKDLPSPLAPESDEEKVQDSGKAAADSKEGSPKPDQKKPEEEPVTVHIDLDNIGQRILALPIPARNYGGMLAGKSGELFLTASAPNSFVPGATVYKFELSSRKTEEFLPAVTSFDVSFNGEKALYSFAGHWAIVPTAQAPKPGQGALKTDAMEIEVDPRAEWKQMYDEIWRIERDYFYDPNFHGLDLSAAKKKYEPYLARLGSREDLNYLFGEMLGELSVGHMYVGGGDIPEPDSVKGGLLGADYSVENGRYRFKRVYNGENWNPMLRAPLTQPGVNVVAGDYLLAVNGRELRSSDNVYSFFEETAGKAVLLKVGSDPSGAGSREVTVVPVEDETALRNRQWIEDNRKKVDQLSGGKLAYVYLPDTAGGGYTNFNRYYFAQIDKEGAVIDERFNGGGAAANYIIDAMQRPLMNYWLTREGHTFTTPADAIFGPKAMIINQFAGSGGDAMPWYFKHAGIGPLVGERTWGGLVGIYGYPPLIDGGFVTAPRVAFFDADGNWAVENHGVAPDVEVDMDPKAVREGHDPQLEKAVAVVMEELKKNPPARAKVPAFPNYHTGRPQSGEAAGAGGTGQSQKK